MASKNFFILIFTIVGIIISTSNCAPNHHPTTIKEENLATNTDIPVTVSVETTNRVQENEVDSEILRDDTATTIATMDENEKSTVNLLVPQQQNDLVQSTSELMRKQLIEHFRKQMTANAIRAVFLILNELKRRQSMGYTHEQQASESNVVESTVQHDGDCACKCNTKVNNREDYVDDDETEVIIIDKTQKRMKNGDRYLPKQKSLTMNDESINKIKKITRKDEVQVNPPCESCRIKGIEEMLYKY